MKILFLLPGIKKCGPVNVMFTLIEGLSKSGVDCYILYLWESPADETEYLNNLGVTFKCLKVATGLKALNPKYIFEFNNQIKSIEPNIVHSSCLFPDYFNILNKLIFRGKGLLYTSTLHCNLVENYNLDYGRFKAKLFVAVHRFILKNMDKVAAVSQHAKSSIPNSNSYLIYNSARLKKSVAFSDDNIRLAFYGVFIELKNIEFLIRAFSDACEKLGRENRNISLELYGRGPLEDELKKRFSKTKNLTFNGYIEEPSVTYKPGLIVVSASKTEGLPMSVIEALGSNIPALLSDIPSHREIRGLIGTGVELFSFNHSSFVEGLERLLADIQDNNEVQQRFKLTLSSDVMEKKYFEFFNQV